MLRRWLVLPACIVGLALFASCSSNTGGQAHGGDTATTFTATTWGDLALGDTAETIRARHSDFPAADTGSTVTWQDADLIFDNGALVSISPRSGGKTDTGLTVKSSLDDARKAYGEPVSALANMDGTATAIFLASAEHQSAFRIELATPTGPINAIALCNCLPEGGGTSSNSTPGITTATTASASPSTSPSDSASSQSSGPEKIVLRPVDANGNAAPGFAKVAPSIVDQPINCSFDGGLPSPVAVDDDIFDCSPDMAGAHACWPSTEIGQALCLTSAFDPTLAVWNTTEPMGTVSTPGNPLPYGLVLEDGSRCVRRNGGAWPSQKSDLSLRGAYGCNPEIIWRTDSGPIDKSGSAWTVLVGTPEGSLRPLKVTTVYYVGTA